MKAYQFLETEFKEIYILDNISAILHWDMNTFMPEGSTESRVEQLSYLTKITHEKICNPRVQDKIELAVQEQAKLGSWQKANLREIKRVYDNYNSIEKRLMQSYVKAAGTCEMIWRSAKQNNDFKSLQKSFKKLLDIVRQIAISKGEYFKVTPYQSLVDQFDPGSRVADIDRIFNELEKFLPNFIEKVSSNQDARPNLTGVFPKDSQKRLSIGIMQALGFNFNQGRLDESAHPFCGGIPQDIRITTKYTEDCLFSSLFGVIHETGHALYEFNLPKKWLKQPVGHAFGMSIHESQSLFSEMQIALSDEFIEYLQPKIVALFDLEPKLFSKNNIAAYLKHVEPSFIRVEADEVTYPLHVILRYQLEKLMINGELEVKDLPTAWNEKFKKKFNITPPTDTLGCLQDIHWPSGVFGYFPSYTLGAITAAQLMHVINKELPDTKADIKEGNFKPIYNWLKDNIHSKARLLPVDKLLISATGEKLNPKYFIEHLKTRYSN